MKKKVESDFNTGSVTHVIIRHYHYIDLKRYIKKTKFLENKHNSEYDY